MDLKPYNKRLSALEQEFESWKLHYKEISRYILPRKGRFLDKDTMPNDGSKRHQDIVDNTGGRALRILAAGMQSGLTSPARPWFKLGLPDKDMQEYGPVRQWLEEVRKRMLYIFHRSNFYTSTHNLYYEMGAFGTGCMAIDQDPDTVIRCYPFTVGEYYLSTDYHHRVDTFYRVFWSTAGNLVGRYGRDKVSQSIRNMVANGNGDKWVQVVNVIEPNPDYLPGRLDAIRKPIRSLTFERKGHNDNALNVAGYDFFPIMAPRWSVTGVDVYGMSPGMETLGDVKMLHKMQTKSLIALDKLVDPPMNAPLHLKQKGASIVPGGVNYLDINSTNQAFAPAYQVQPDFKSIEYKIEKIQMAIREGFFADLFLLIANSPKDMTATEVLERHEEKLLMLGPVIERIQPELLDRVIDRTFYLMEDAGMLPQVPPELAGADLEVEYISLLAQAQKMVGVTAIEQVAAFVGNLSAVKPEVLDKFNQDEAVDLYADMVGVPPSIIFDDEQVKKVRAERAALMRQQEQMQNMMSMAEGAKTLSQADTGGNNALNALMGQAQPPADQPQTLQ